MSDLILQSKYTIKYKINNLNIIDYIYNLTTKDKAEILNEISMITGAKASEIDILDIKEQ